MHISLETPQQTEQRLLNVFSRSHLEIFEGEWIFEEFAPNDFPSAVQPEARAIVRDRAVWSQLIPANARSKNERFALFSFHFPNGLDNSGFVGWLATHLKHQLGTGIFVICGQNSGAGGIYDYWGVPAAMGPAVLAEFRAMSKSLAHKEIA
jgi:hypothetical protein